MPTKATIVILVLENCKYDAHRNAFVSSGTGFVAIANYQGNLHGNTRLFTGREYDGETGLYYFRARYYSANLGRFIQRDPIGMEDQINLYTYVGNNPVRFSDPSGEVAKQMIQSIFDSNNIP